VRERQIAIGITIDEMQRFFGSPKHLVDYTFKGRPGQLPDLSNRRGRRVRILYLRRWSSNRIWGRRQNATE